ncbi:MAG TPA: DUF1549 and DUF1553 domain-containing protein [Pirellulales bacterium]|jgi:hypothetical protein|nr:DUF1549 and DUF1553 domain-containing protein [Pirellulales bacterium]
MNLRFIPFAAALLATLSLAVSGRASEADRRLNFANDVVPIFTKASCNSGACHAKAGSGQNGFRLSLLGFEPQEDYEHIVTEGHGRRVFPASPQKSLLLLKASNTIPHGGGKRLDVDSDGYKLLASWIGQGMPYADQNDPKLVSIEVQPSRGTVAAKSEQQLKVLAHYSDGSERDVTARALYEPNDKAMAAVDEAGRVQIRDIPGNVAVMVRYQGLVSVFNASVPLGAKVENLPPAKNFIDELVFANLTRIGIPPSSLCDDATFLRRVSLDVAGHLPTVEETRAFLSDSDPAKRDHLIESLLATADYADYFANKWSALLKNRRDIAGDKPSNFAFHFWLRDSLAANKPYDQIVRELLGATGDVVGNPAVAWYKRVKDPEQQLEDVAQLFLGVRMHCSQCHHHPFDRWSQADYYSFSAFFSQIGRRPTATHGEDAIFHKRGVAQATNKKTRLPVKPAGLGDASLDIPPDEDPRLRLAAWMSNPSNPYFAKSLVNRYWKHFFKRGLIEPEDDIRDTNPPSNPDLLDALARQFVASGYDLKSIVRLIVESHAYQLSAMPNDCNEVDRQNFSRFYPSRMTAEVLLDAVDQLAGAHSDFADMPSGTHAIALPDSSYSDSSYFLSVFGRPDGASVCECERVQSSSLAQSLYLMNGKEIKAKLAANGGRADLLAKDARPVEEKIAELYLAAFSRAPNADEVSAATAYLARVPLDAQGKPVDAQRAAQQAYEDLLWAIINTKEFLYNH